MARAKSRASRVEVDASFLLVRLTGNSMAMRANGYGCGERSATRITDEIRLIASLR